MIFEIFIVKLSYLCINNNRAVRVNLMHLIVDVEAGRVGLGHETVEHGQFQLYSDTITIVYESIDLMV